MYLAPQSKLRALLSSRDRGHGGKAAVEEGRSNDSEAGATQANLRRMPHSLLRTRFCRGCSPRLLRRRTAAHPAEAHGSGCGCARCTLRCSHRRRLRPLSLDQRLVRRLASSNTAVASERHTLLTERLVLLGAAASYAIVTRPSGSCSPTSSAPTQTRRTCGARCRSSGSCSPAQCGASGRRASTNVLVQLPRAGRPAVAEY